MRRFNISMASKCLCCEEEESVKHVFMTSELAKAVWGHFNSWFSLSPVNYPSVSALLGGWRESHDWVKKGHIRTIIPLIILWTIWKIRNRAKHKGGKMNAKEIITAVEQKIRCMLGAKIWKGSQYKGEELFQYIHNIKTLKTKKESIVTFRWRKPDLGCVKLNTDGCSRGNPGMAAAGAILRDHQGKVIFSFCKSLGIQTAYMAELMALRDGLQICKNLEIQQLWIELDSKILWKHITEKGSGNWRSNRLLAEVGMLLRCFTWSCSHIWREGNAAADWLANLGLRSPEPCLLMGLPSCGEIRGIVLLDAIGTNYFRAFNSSSAEGFFP